MYFQPFHELFPEVAVKETRSITLLEPQDGLPAGSYAFIETFCNKPGCDCRRVLFTVVKDGLENEVATIGWGWEPLEFYAKWMYWDPDPESVKDLKGPSLNLLSVQSELAEGALKLCRDVLIQDPVFVERIVRHYRMFRSRIDKSSNRTAASSKSIQKNREKAKRARKARQAARRRNRK